MEHIIKSTYPLHERMFQSNDIVPNDFLRCQIAKHSYSIKDIHLLIQPNFEWNPKIHIDKLSFSPLKDHTINLKIVFVR